MSETLSGYVQAKERTKSGKAWKLKLNGKYISVSNRANMDGVDQGSFVEYELGGFQGDNGWVSTIDRIRPAQAPQGQPPPQTNGSSAIGAARLRSAFWDDSALRLISNVIGSAIEAGHCDSPDKVSQWALGAEMALLALGPERDQKPAQTSGLVNNTSRSAPREPSSDDDPGFDSDDALRF